MYSDVKYDMWLILHEHTFFLHIYMLTGSWTMASRKGDMYGDDRDEV
jgi:hypothetical protein